ncbi:MAG: thiamine-phosphate kinase [Armatimonadota bacterium]|nr:thiamine-phosphate kinase [Armatimonadota bacterium]MDR7519802.1 thiamine-phosphate kinase [Armatimonadota bacterium]MDR7549567.1 thiamine-phosphate kinase [Armatimonadota bacterium]
MTRVADVGELALLARIDARIGPASGDVVIGVGDDTAALRWPAGRLVLMTTDALVEDVHFRRATGEPADVGWKALAINASDIAAMGGTPTHAVVSLMLPGDLDVDWVDDLYEGLLEMARGAGIALVGGNLAQAPAIIVDVALLGEVDPQVVVRRSGARPGDLVVVTGTLGRAAAGLLALEGGGNAGLGARPRAAPGAVAPGGAVPGGTALEWVLAAQRRPRPRLAEGRALAASRVVRAMIDLSDGLALDLWRVCEASGVGVRLDGDRLPVDASAAEIAGAAGRDPLDVALFGGEDYELLFAVAPQDADRALRLLSEEVGTPGTVIGTFVPASAGRTIVVGGRPRPLEPGGWTHFRHTPAR